MAAFAADTEAKAPEVSGFRARAVTSGPKNHFFGYYGISPWDQSGKYLLCVETDFHDRMPGADDTARVGVVDAETGEFRPVAETRAWNYQQGAFERWLPGGGSKIIFNDREGGEFISVVLDVETGERAELPRPISALAHSGKFALSFNFARLSRLRPDVGYRGAVDPFEASPRPENDGIYFLDLETGGARLLVSFADVVRSYKGKTDLSGRELWIDHTDLNPSDTRLLFLVRYGSQRAFDTAMFTIGVDGGDLRLVIDFGLGVSHFGWQSDTRILATMEPEGRGSGYKHVIFSDAPDGWRNLQVLGRGVLTQDGHPSFSPDRTLMVTDTYSFNTGYQYLYLLDVESDKVQVLGKYRHPMKYIGFIRCDLHPRFSADGTKISFDSIAADNTRQLFVVDLKK